MALKKRPSPGDHASIHGAAILLAIHSARIGLLRAVKHFRVVRGLRPRMSGLEMGSRLPNPILAAQF